MLLKLNEWQQLKKKKKNVLAETFFLKLYCHSKELEIVLATLRRLYYPMKWFSQLLLRVGGRGGACRVESQQAVRAAWAQCVGRH